MNHRLVLLDEGGLKKVILDVENRRYVVQSPSEVNRDEQF